MGKYILESPVYTLEAALLAAKYGVNRLELCADYTEGGTSPSLGMFSYIKSKINIPVFVMIRPRGGDFVYSDEELEVMKKEIELFQSHGADGFVFGILKANGEINMGACEELIEQAEGLPCTFHRAFDASVSLEKSLEAIIECGFRRILTSGGKNTVSDGLKTIQKLMQQAGSRIVIMPGGGTEPEHLGKLHQTGFLKEVHASCKTWRPSKSTYHNRNLQIKEGEDSTQSILTVDKKKVLEFKKKLQSFS